MCPPCFQIKRALRQHCGTAHALLTLASALSQSQQHEVKLWNNAQEQDDWERLANLVILVPSYLRAFAHTNSAITVVCAFCRRGNAAFCSI